MSTALVIGAGPAGLMVADVLSAAGVKVVVADQMPSPARKLLMAGKSGLNLTKSEGMAAFLGAYPDMPEPLRQAVDAFGPEAVVDWARGLGQEVFTGSTGRVFPTAMKASPLLRAWLARLERQHVQLWRRWRLVGLENRIGTFETPEGTQHFGADVVILALGGGSWRRLGSDGRWVSFLEGTVPFLPSNCGFHVRWSDHMQPFFGQPVKATALYAGSEVSRGEWILSERGIEGGGVYQVSSPLREGALLGLDLLPDVSYAELQARVARRKPKQSLAAFLRSGLKLPPVKAALYQELSRRAWQNTDDLTRLKALPVPVDAPFPLDEAISTAGGLRFEAMDEWMLRDRPGVFAAGEMLDWDAPTGGYLITACLATGKAAAEAALTFLESEGYSMG